MEFVFNLALTSALLSLVLWVSKANPVLGGFIVSLPISTLIVLALSKAQSQDPANSFLLAKSIFVAVPASLLFFVPFLLAPRFKLPFWTAYAAGLGLLILSYGIHRWVMSRWVS